MTREAGRGESFDERAVLLVAGASDMAVSAIGSVFGAVRGLLRRSDAGELAAEAEHELMARGRLVLDRYVAPPPAHLELLARHVVARRAAEDV